MYVLLYLTLAFTSVLSLQTFHYQLFQAFIIHNTLFTLNLIELPCYKLGEYGSFIFSIQALFRCKSSKRKVNFKHRKPN
jgi:hypothetical protein